MQYQSLTLDHKDLYNKYWEKCPQKTADYIFTNLFTWNNFYDFEIAEDNNLLWIKSNHDLRAPLGDWENVDFTKSTFLKKGTVLTRVPEKLKDILFEQFQDNIEIATDRDNDEYIYLQENLANLRGKDFHKKKNHVNSFTKNFGIDYRQFTAENLSHKITKDLLELHETWCKNSGCGDDDSLYAEYTGIKNILESLTEFPNIIGGTLYHENKLAAFTLGEKLDESTFVVHFEKALPEYKGAYQAINNIFAKNAVEGFEFINREQDLGNAGLRAAKETYKPTHFLKKFTITIN